MLLSASPYYLSGSLLAERLKMSRVGVWSRIDKLRKVGLCIEAAQNRGYRLAGEPNQLNIHLLEAWLSENAQPCKVFLRESTDSTNSEAERLLANGNPAPFAVLANTQTQGRGRLGRSWHSPRDGNLYLSVAFRPDVDLIKLRSFT
ncbi:MAG: HTH domain-containing protein, partial [Verrucomicrobiota bacterium]|nr:HTH domain-containing protein [Verrucomicrobiota bacterium]